jgi:formamidopyrimidine-DNA glycosylase
MNFVFQSITVNPMSQGSNWNLIDRYGESLHSSDVVNSRELKFCEGCGVLLVRLQGSKTQFCPGCEAPVAIAMGRL